MAKEIRQTSLDLTNVRTHGRSYVARVLSSRMNATVTVTWDRKIYVPKFERYMLKTSKAKAHNPDSLGAKEGDLVRIQQCRPISKTKNFIVTEILEDSAENSSADSKNEASKASSKVSSKASSSKKTASKKK